MARKPAAMKAACGSSARGIGSERVRPKAPDPRRESTPLGGDAGRN
jgi:hypothetical protein